MGKAMGAFRRRLTGVVAAACLATVIAVPAARADDPPFVGWTALLPPLTFQYSPDSVDDCVAGRVNCVKKTIEQMQDRYDPLAASCDHEAVFSLTYLRVTQTYLQTAQTAGFYQDAPWVNHEDAAFAEMYFDAHDNWAAGNLSKVPQAWRITFDAAAAREVNGGGDLLLGINAHVNRDLPLLLAGLGLVAPDGSSRKPDHDKIDVMLNMVVEPLVQELGARYDPSFQNLQTPYGVGYTGLLQTLVAWREQAWRNAELLVSAPDDATRAQLVAGIEAAAATQAQAIVASSAYLPPLTSTASRDAYCQAQAPSGA